MYSMMWQQASVLTEQLVQEPQEEVAHLDTKMMFVTSPKEPAMIKYRGIMYWTVHRSM